MKNKNYIETLLRDWSLLLAMYNRNMEIYDSHSRIYKFFAMLDEPRHPGYHSYYLVRGGYLTIELGFLNRPILKCNDGFGHGYKLDIITGEKSPCLGGKGTKVNETCESLMQEYAKEILIMIEPYINNIK